MNGNSNGPLDTIPLEEDWGDISERDIYYAYEYFGRKSNDALQCEFDRNISERCFNLDSMPIKPFLYYIFGLTKYIDSLDHENINLSLAANAFIEILIRKSTKYPNDIKMIYPKLASLIKDISENKSHYDIDVETYGNLRELTSEMRALMSAAL